MKQPVVMWDFLIYYFLQQGIYQQSKHAGFDDPTLQRFKKNKRERNDVQIQINLFDSEWVVLLFDF